MEKTKKEKKKFFLFYYSSFQLLANFQDFWNVISVEELVSDVISNYNLYTLHFFFFFYSIFSALSQMQHTLHFQM